MKFLVSMVHLLTEPKEGGDTTKLECVLPIVHATGAAADLSAFAARPICCELCGDSCKPEPLMRKVCR